MIARLTCLAAAFALLQGCGAISSLSSAGRPLDTFELTPMPASSAVVRGSRHLVVEPPTAAGSLATERIAIKPNAFQVAYLPGVRWADPAPQHLQMLLARSLEGTGAFALVSTEGGRVDPDWFLATDLQAFQVELDAGGDARAVVRLRAVLVSDADRRIRGARSFERSVPAASTEVGAVVPAFDAATTAILRDVAQWTVATVR